MPRVSWQDGDIAMINNKRVLHCRRAIMGNLIDRKLFIGMGYQLSFFIFYESIFFVFYGVMCSWRFISALAYR
jgi:hypothetical protein